MVCRPYGPNAAKQPAGPGQVSQTLCSKLLAQVSLEQWEHMKCTKGSGMQDSNSTTQMLLPMCDDVRI